MLSIQQAGTEILGNKPGKFYIFTGTEYGVKRKYLEHLKQFYKNAVTAETVSEVFDAMQRKSLIPVPPKLYVVRYDEDFVSALNDRSAARISKMKINGTIVCLYEADRSAAKCAKYLPDNTVSFDHVHSEFVKQYLHSDFPALSDICITEAVRIHSDYMGAYNICTVLSVLSDTDRDSIDPKAMESIFGYSLLSEDSRIKEAFAARDVQLCLNLIENYTNEPDMVFYIMLSALIELEKLLINPKQRSDFKRYIKAWTIESVYNMFLQVYAELETSREFQGYNVRDRLVYLVLLLRYNPIPQLEVMKSGL